MVNNELRTVISLFILFLNMIQINNLAIYINYRYKLGVLNCVI